MGEQRLPSLKFMVSSSVLDLVTEPTQLRERALVQAYLVESLNACKSLGDIKLFLPPGMLNKIPLSDVVEKSTVSMEEELAMQIKDRHEEAYGYIQQYLLLSMIED